MTTDQAELPGEIEGFGFFVGCDSVKHGLSRLPRYRTAWGPVGSHTLNLECREEN